MIICAPPDMTAYVTEAVDSPYSWARAGVQFVVSCDDPDVVIAWHRPRDMVTVLTLGEAWPDRVPSEVWISTTAYTEDWSPLLIRIINHEIGHAVFKLPHNTEGLMADGGSLLMYPTTAEIDTARAAVAAGALTGGKA